jgi:hypothetical protein
MATDGHDVSYDWNTLIGKHVLKMEISSARPSVIVEKQTTTEGDNEADGSGKEPSDRWYAGLVLVPPSSI